MDTTELEYEPLDRAKREIRLIKLLQPKSDDQNEVVECTLEHGALHDYKEEYLDWEKEVDETLPARTKTHAWWTYVRSCHENGNTSIRAGRYPWGDYVALSYVWGSTEDTVRIVVNGKTFLATRNLDRALRAIRRSNSELLETLRIWADAICINQGDVEERGREVRWMREIYEKSMSVAAYIGEEMDGSDLAMNYTKQLEEEAKKGVDHKARMSHLITSFSWSIASDEQIQEARACSALIQLMARPYWTRVWIIQELAMDNDQMKVGCGNRWVSLGAIRRAMKIMTQNYEAIGRLELELLGRISITYRSASAMLWWLGRLRSWTNLPDDRTDITFTELRWPLLNLAQMANSTDPRDKVYAVASLLPRKLRDRVVIDYRATVKDVYAEFSKTVIEVTKELDIIYMGSFWQKKLSGLEGLPTWATDWQLWESRTGSNGWNGLFFDWKYSTAGDGDEPHVLGSRASSLDFPRAGGQVNSSLYQAHFSGQFLTCQGLCVGYARSISRELVAMSHTQEADTVLSKESIESPYADKSAIAEAILRVLLFDSDGVRAKQSSVFQIPWFGEEADLDAVSGTFTLGVESQEVLKKLQESDENGNLSSGIINFEYLRRRIGDFRVGELAFKDFFTETTSAARCDWPRSLSEDLLIIQCNVENRRLITTKTGHIGLAPTTICPEDGIYVIFGCSMPVVLRPTARDGQYEVIGECYLDGFMVGEAITAYERGQYQIEGLTLS